ncbi:MAG: hypothetical protein AAB071_03720 [Bacteroidota bacterium]
MKHNFYFLLLLGLFSLRCNHGLEPYKETAGFSGTITYRGTWLPDSEIVTIHLVASKVPPPFRFDSLLAMISSGDVQFVPPDFTQTLPTNVSVTQYAMLVPLATYNYLAVVLQKSQTEITPDNFPVIGVYSEDTITFSPKAITVRENQFHRNINITVDFQRFPPTPYELKK